MRHNQYKQIAHALQYLTVHPQASLKELANEVGLSETYFQKVFSAWAGVSPKQFSKYIQFVHSAPLLRKHKNSLLQVTSALHISSTSRLYDLCIHMVAMTPAEYKNHGQGIEIHFSTAETPFGMAMIGSTHRGICFVGFHSSKKEGIQALHERFPRAQCREQLMPMHTTVAEILCGITSQEQTLHVHVKGTPFQLHVWEALLHIPQGQCVTYGEVASAIEKPKAVRAVGTAIGANPISYLIPCHRVIRETGALGGYHWGVEVKERLLAREWASTGHDEKSGV